MGELKPKLLFVVTEDWYFCSHRLPLPRAARDSGFDVVVVTRLDRDEARIRAEGFRVIPLDLRRGEVQPLCEILSLFRIARIFRAVCPAIVHNVAMKPVVLGTIASIDTL